MHRTKWHTPWIGLFLTGRQLVPFPCILQALILAFRMSEMRDSSSSASGCQLLQEGRGRKAVVGTWLPMLAKHRERSRMLPLCSRQTLLAGLPSDSSCARTPPGPKSFLVWFYFFFFCPTLGAAMWKLYPGLNLLTSNIQYPHFFAREDYTFFTKWASMLSEKKYFHGYRSFSCRRIAYATQLAQS